MTTTLFAPTEGPLMRKYGAGGISSSVPETRGADILFSTPHGLMGIQRKQVPHDFLKSISDSRLAREVLLLKQLPLSMVIGEGHFRYYPDTTVAVPGAPRAAYRQYTRKRIWGVVLDIMIVHGVPVVFVDDMDATAAFIKYLQDFITHGKRTSIYRRPNVQGQWGTPTAKEEYLWLLQGLPKYGAPGVGVSLADRILKCFGGIPPIRWSCRKSDLARVPGVGKKTIDMLWGALPATNAHPEIDDEED